MKCPSVAKLLPLYVEGDLPRRKDARVREHLRSCLPCRGLAEEYRGSQQWLHASAGPALPGEKLEELRQAVWRRLDEEPRPSALWLAFERGWIALRRWAGQPSVAVAAVGLVVLGSVTMTRMAGVGGARLGVPADLPHEELSSDATEPSDDPEFLATATPDELVEGAEPGEAEATEETADHNMRIEIQTKDPNVRIIWLTPPTTEAAPVEN
jgi:anti-sigma factor RsiW